MYLLHHMMKINNNLLIIGKIFVNNLNSTLFVREIERLSKIDIKTLHKELKYLVDKNILDFKDVGKIKVYSLKNTFEAKIFLELVENYKTLEFIQTNKQLKLKLYELDNLVDFIVFGSYANYTNTKVSDLDIVIFSKEDKKIMDKFKEFGIKIHPHFIEFQEFVKLSRENYLLALEIIKNHISFGKTKKIVNLYLRDEKRKQN